MVEHYPNYYHSVSANEIHDEDRYLRAHVARFLSKPLIRGTSVEMQTRVKVKPLAIQRVSWIQSGLLQRKCMKARICVQRLPRQIIALFETCWSYMDR